MMLLAPLLVLLPAASPEIAVAASADRTAIRLSESVRVTLTVEGPAPLRIDLAESIPDESSAIVWRVRPVGPARIEELPNQRHRWSREFRADPFAVGQPLKLGFAPVTVHAGTDPRAHSLTWPAIEVTVTSSLSNPTTADIRPITGIEPVPIPIVEPRNWLRPVFWILAIGIVVAGLAVTIHVRYFRKPRTQLMDLLQKKLNQLSIAQLNSREFAERFSQHLRLGIEHYTAIPATQRTSEEILQDPELIARTDSLRSSLAPIFRTIDGARYANQDLTPGEREDLLQSAALVLIMLAEFERSDRGP